MCDTCDEVRMRAAALTSLDCEKCGEKVYASEASHIVNGRIVHDSCPAKRPAESNESIRQADPADAQHVYSLRTGLRIK